MKQFLHSLAITLCIALMATGAQAQTITAEQAKEIANNFFQNGKQKSAAVRSTVSLAKSADSRILSNGSSNEAPTFHILTPASGEGFVIVSGEEIENPIIGYSLDGTIDTNNLPVGFVDYITDIDAQVKALRKYNAENPQKAAAARSAMQKTNYNATTMGNKVYLETASWGQDYPFNAQCFTSYNGSTNALTGCVPTAYAIIMRYHEWPQVGTGTLYNCQAPTYVEITDRTYDYSKMPLVYDGNWSTEQINEVAKLMSHLGHSFMVTYGSSQTSVSDPSNTDKPNKFFNYNLVYASYQANFTMDSWEEKIKESIDNGCPIPYASDNAGTGDTRHMFVLDGYTANDYFHFNFGWKGNSNGWFKLDAITPSQGDDYSWQSGADHYAIFNFTPNKTKYAVNASVSPENAGTVSLNGSAAASSATGEYLQGATVTLAATANTGYTFSNWTKGGEVVSTNKSCQIKVASSDNDYVANFLTVGNTTVNVSVTYNSSYGTVTGTSGTVATGTTLTPRLNEEVTLTATPADGYIFTGWTVTKGTEDDTYNTNTLTFVATGEMSVTANFALAVQDYVVNPTTGTLNNGTNRSSVWTFTTAGDFTAALSISATDSNGNVVNSITNKTSGTAGHYFASSGIIANTETPSSSPTIYTISVPNGYKITGYAITYYPENGSITLTNELGHNETATNSSSDYYLNASGLNVQSTTYTVAGTGRMTTLSFSVTVMKDGAGSGATPTQYTITATANPGTAGSVTGGGTYTEGATVTLTATPNSGYEFVNWTKGGIEVSTNATYSFTANASAEYVAHFQTAAVTTFAVTTTANPAAGGTATFAVGTGQATTSANVASGTGVTLYAVANDGYRFVNWTKGGMEVSTNATHNVTITEASDFVANFEETEEELPITGTGLDITFNGATGFPNSGNTNQVQTATDPVITISSDENNIGFSTIDGVKHPYLFKNCSFTISVPEPYRIAGYKLTVTGHNFDQGTITYTAGAQLARSNTATATIEGTTPKTVIATGLNNSEININVGNALETTAGVIITALEIDYVEEAQAGTFPDGAYKIFWQQNGRGYLAYHTGYPNEAKLADVTYPECQNKHFASTSPEVDLVWYLITAQDGNRYLFHAATGKFLAANADVSPTNTSKANKLSTTEALSIRIEENTAHSGHYVIMATVNSTDALLSSGCGTSSETGNPVRWWYDNANGEFMSDGGSPLQFVSTTADVSDAIMNQVRLVIDGVDITANAGAGGSVTINGEATGTRRVIKGSSVTLNATPASGYSFLNWSNTEGIVSETAEYTFTANGATTLTANFERITYTVNVNANPIEGGTATFAVGTNPATTSASVAGGTLVTLYAVANTGYRFVNWTNGTSTISSEATANVTINANSNFVANFEQEVQDVLTTGYYHLVSRATSSHEYLYNNALRTNNSKEFTLQSDSKITTNNGIWYITVNSNQLGVKNGDGNALVTGAQYCGNATSHNTLNIEKTTIVDNVTYYSFIEGINCTNRTQYDFTLEGGTSVSDTDNNYVTTWTGHPDDNANQWRFERVDTEGKNIYNVVVECTDNDVYVTYGSEYAFNGGFFITNETITAQQLTAKKNNAAAQDVTVLVEGNTIRVVDTESVDITVSTTPAEGGTATINGEATGTKRVVKGSEVTLAANANDGYNFTGWYNGETLISNENPYTFTATASGSYEARFEVAAPVTYTISVSAYPGTAGTASIGTETSTTVTAGEQVTLTAVPNSGYNFAGWYKGETKVSDATSYTFVPTESANYVARFEVAAPVTYTISVSADPGTAGTASIGTETSTTVTAGEQVTLTAVPNSGYNFAGWYKDETKVSDATSYTFVPTESANYVARFEEEAAVGGGNDTVHNIVTNGTTGEVSELDGSFYKVWTSSNSPKIVLTSSGYTISTNNYELRLRAATYTLSLDNSVDEDLQIVSYTINYRKNSASSSITLSAEGEDDQTPGATTDLQQFVVDSFDPTRSTSFTVATGQAGQAIWVESIDVTIRSSAPTHYTVSVVSGEGGNAYIGASGTETETTITIGSNVTLRAEVTEGYEFDGWYDSNGKFISDVLICTITPDDNMTYTAKFYALVEANKYYKLQCQGSNKYYLSSNIDSADNNRLMMNGTNRIFYYGTLINEFDNIDDDIEANQKKLLAYTEGNFVGIKKRATGDYYDVTLLDNRNEISHNVKFNAGTNGNVMISVEYVEYVDENEISTYFYLDGNGTSVSSNTNYINDNSHNWKCEEVESLPVAISSAQHATLYAPVALEIPDGVRAYVLDASKIDGTSKDIVLTRLSSIIPANTGVILKGNEGTYDFNITESTDDAEAEVAGNALDGTVARTRVVGDAYILAVREGKVGLYPLAGNSYINPDIQTSSFTNGSHKAYLPVKDDTLGEILKKSTGVRFIYSDEIVTGIQDGILYDGAEGESIYDLQGRKLSEITEPGIYIVNGKKRFIK